MDRIAVIDLDEISVDNRERAALATRADGTLDWAALFDNAQIAALDRPIPSALARLHTLAGEGLTIWYVTSRPDSCQATTVAWLAANGYPFPANVLCRPQFERTIAFKAAAVARLHAEAGPVVLFADDRESNRQAVAALNIPGLTVESSL